MYIYIYIYITVVAAVVAVVVAVVVPTAAAAVGSRWSVARGQRPAATEPAGM